MPESWSQLDAINERVTTLHTKVGAMSDLVARHDERITAHDARLRDGAQTFDDMRKMMIALKDEIRGPKAPWWIFATLAVSILSTLATIAFNFMKR